MVVALSFPYIRPRRSPSYRKKEPHRPPPLKLHTSFFQSQDLKIEGPAPDAGRGSVSGPSEDKGPVEVPLKLEVEVSETSDKWETLSTFKTSEEDIRKRHTAMENHPPEEKGKEHEKEDKGKESASSVPKATSADTRSVSSRGSLRTIIQLDSDSLNDSDNSEVSPISDDRPPIRPGNAIRRFFPELFPDQIDLISPEGGEKAKTKLQRTSPGFEDELQERVQSLCRSPMYKENKAFSPLGPEASSSSGSDGIFDSASSCYSDRSSQSSVGMEFPGKDQLDYPYMSADAYSILSPVAAGVFDDAASVCSSRAPSVLSRQQAPSPSSSSSSGCSSVTSKKSVTSMNDLKNKPLPLEPVSESDIIVPSPLAVRRHTPPLQSPNPPTSVYSTSPMHTPPIQRSATSLQSQSSHACQACGGHSQRRRKGNRSEWTEHIEKGEPHIRQLPSLAQAAEELEDVLADLQRHGSKQRTLLILDGPLQVSRHNGDLVATRPAPQPPSTKPHSMTHPPLTESLKTNKSLKSSKSKKEKEKNKVKRSSEVQKDRRPVNLASIPEGSSTRGHTYSSSSKSGLGHKKSQSADDTPDANVSKNTPGTTPGESASPEGAESKSGKENDRLRKTLTLMKSFKRRPQPTAAPAIAPSRELLHADRLDPPNPLDPLHIPDDTSDDAPPKRDSLRLQLPRLQTDLAVTRLLDTLHGIEPGVARPTGSPTQPTADERPQSPNAQQERQSVSSKEKILVRPSRMLGSEKMRQTHAFVSTAQASSVRLPPEQIYELAATPPSPTATISGFDANQQADVMIPFPADLPQSLVRAIMERIDSLDDLFNFVLVNKSFYNVFKKHELPMIKNALFKMSPPAWELREMSPPWATEAQLLEPDAQVPEYSPSLYLDRYASDIFTLAKLKSMILVRCSPFLRRDTVRGLSGMDVQRAEEVDDAFWRIWTFCRIFGSNKGRENDLEGQVDWLKGGVKARGYTGAASCMTEPFGMNNVLFEPPEGFGRGNGRGLSPKQLYDMTEIWTCMGVLLQPLHGKCIEARKVGIYEGMDVPREDHVREEQVLEEWTSYVLTIGLSAVLGLSSLAPAEATATFFKNAKASGLTKWELTETQTSRSSFLKEAVSRVYEDQERAISQSDSQVDALTEEQLRQQQREKRHQEYVLELRVRRARNAKEPTIRDLGTGSGFSQERPMSEFSTIVHNLDGADCNVPPVPALPSMMLDRASTSTNGSDYVPRTPAFTPPPQFSPPQHFTMPPHFSDTSIPIVPARSPPVQHPALMPAPANPPTVYSLPPQVQDPVDRAINRMVNELGFNEEDVKWALKITDTGEGIDVEAAESLLKQEKKKKKPFSSRKESLLHSVMKRQRSTDSGWRFAA
ncbi:hypothetical protein N7532_002559 [Penicillium argentinense]|uniref:Uncharacterized protein n=1 Tax=Penicillium argentinense TaxID=1131581 RepID=A0A9W9G0L2_9EURO|nr:uncharacterized protein N7532_002559 [Penicillium argentinense]KAJ5109914.1 hypothetical protein N7532_002559 [Penicillium argentinense]